MATVDPAGDQPIGQPVQIRVYVRTDWSAAWRTLLTAAYISAPTSRPHAFPHLQALRDNDCLFVERGGRGILLTGMDQHIDRAVCLATSRASAVRAGRNTNSHDFTHPIITLVLVVDAGVLIAVSVEAPARVLETAARPRNALPLTGVHGEGRILLAACDTNESAWEQPGTGHGLLTSIQADQGPPEIVGHGRGSRHSFLKPTGAQLLATSGRSTP